MKLERYPKRTMEQYFPTPNEIFCLGLCPEEYAIYSYLLSIENEKYQCWPSYKTIGENVNIKSKNTVKKYVDSLCEKRFIETEYTDIIYDGKKFNGNLKYTIRPIYEAIMYRMKKQIEENEKVKKIERLRKLLEKYEVTADNQVS